MNGKNTNYTALNEVEVCEDCGFEENMAGCVFDNGDTATGETLTEDGVKYYIAIDENGLPYETAEVPHAAGRNAAHHPDCQCAVCVYGADRARWAFDPGEY